VQALPEEQVSREDIVDALMGASRALVAVAARSVAEVSEEVTLPQFRALVTLASAGPQPSGALGDELGVSASTVSRLCDRLIGKGLVDRRPGDTRREVTIDLTEEGRALVARVMRIRRREIGRILARVPGEDQPHLVRALRAFSDAAGDVPEQSWSSGWGRPHGSRHDNP
jgi:DNA-binding MarR family transcriptional regulator